MKLLLGLVNIGFSIECYSGAITPQCNVLNLCAGKCTSEFGCSIVKTDIAHFYGCLGPNNYNETCYKNPNYGEGLDQYS